MAALGFLNTSNLLYDNCRRQFPVFRAFPSLQYWRVQQAAKPLPDFVAETFWYYVIVKETQSLA